MNDAILTLSGNVATDVRYSEIDEQVRVASFRLACTPRRFDRTAKRWTDEETLYLSVTCWRALGDNVARSLHKGDPVVVVGRVRMKSWQRDDGTTGNTMEMTADAVGHDLARGISKFSKVVRSREISPDDDPELREQHGLDAPADVDPATGELLSQRAEVAGEAA